MISCHILTGGRLLDSPNFSLPIPSERILNCWRRNALLISSENSENKVKQNQKKKNVNSMNKQPSISVEEIFKEDL